MPPVLRDDWEATARSLIPTKRTGSWRGLRVGRPPWPIMPPPVQCDPSEPGAPVDEALACKIDAVANTPCDDREEVRIYGMPDCPLSGVGKSCAMGIAGFLAELRALGFVDLCVTLILQTLRQIAAKCEGAWKLDPPPQIRTDPHG